MNTLEENHQLKVGDYFVSPINNSIVSSDGTSCVVPELTFSLLLKLIHEAPNVVSQKELIQKVWGNQYVSDETLQQRIKLLRQALNDTPSSPKYIATVRNKGYKLIAPIQIIEKKFNKKQQDPVAKTHILWKFISAILMVLVMFLFWQNFNHRNTNITKVSNQNSGLEQQLIRSIAVLPMKVSNDNIQSKVFAEGLSTQLTLALSYIDEIQLADKDSLAKYLHNNHTPLQIGKKLKVDSIIIGEVKKEDSNIHVKVSMFNVVTGDFLWVKEFTTEFKDIFKIQTQIAEKIAHSLQLQLNPLAQKMLAQPTKSLSAYEYYLKADQYLKHLQKEDNEIALELSMQAIALDKNYTDAYILLGFAHVFRHGHWGFPDSSLDEAIKQANIAIALDPKNSTAHYLLGLAYEYKFSISPGDWAEKAVTEYKIALEINPNDLNAKTALIGFDYRDNKFGAVLKVLFETLLKSPSSVLTHRRIGGIFEDLNYNDIAIQWYEKALILKPDYYDVMMNLSEIHESLGHYDLAFKYTNKVLKRYPDQSYDLFQKADLYFNLGNFEQAETTYKHAIMTLTEVNNINSGYYSTSYINLYVIYQKTNRPQLASELLKTIFPVIKSVMDDYPNNTPSYMVDMAMIDTINGNDESALLWLHKAVDTGFISDDWLQQQPNFQPLFKQGKLNDILKRIEQITLGFRSQVQESGVLKENAMHLDKNSIHQ